MNIVVCVPYELTTSRCVVATSKREPPTMIQIFVACQHPFEILDVNSQSPWFEGYLVDFLRSSTIRILVGNELNSNYLLAAIQRSWARKEPEIVGTCIYNSVRHEWPYRILVRPCFANFQSCELQHPQRCLRSEWTDDALSNEKQRQPELPVIFRLQLPSSDTTPLPGSQSSCCRDQGQIILNWKNFSFLIWFSIHADFGWLWLMK